MNAKDQEYSTAKGGSTLLGYFCRQHPPANACQAGAHGVTDTPAQHNPKKLLVGGQRHGSNLGAVAPFRQEGEGKTLSKNLFERNLSRNGRG
jgi:hypothetical protein